MKRWRWSFLALLMVVVPSSVRAQTPADSVSSGNARTYDAAHPWFIEGSIGAIQPGPDGSDLGSGQNFAFDLGFGTNTWSDLSLLIGWVHARKTEEAIDTDITSGTLRARAWWSAGRFLAYGEGGAGLYRFSLKQNSTQNQLEDNRLRPGGLLGLGVQYARTGWWAGLGAQVHAAIGSSNVEGGDVLTLTTYNLTVGAPIGR